MRLLVSQQAVAGKLTDRRSSRRLLRSLTLAPLLCIVGFGCLTSPAAAGVSPAGGLTVHTFAPLGEFSQAKNGLCETIETGICYSYMVTATNSGSVPSVGPIMVKDELPRGFTVSNIEFFLLRAVPLGANQLHGEKLEENECSQQGTPVTVTCTFPEALEPAAALRVRLRLTVGAEAQDLALNDASVSGPESPEASVSEPLRVGPVLSAFGANDLETYIAGVDGAPDLQAGDHPYEMTTRLDLNDTVRVSVEGPRKLTSVHDLKDVIVDLPLGLVGDAQATPKCKYPELASVHHCPSSTRVGQISTQPDGPAEAYTAIYNLVPEPGVAAEFGFNDALDATHVIYASVRPTPSGYVLRATTREIPQVQLTDATVTFYGEPAVRDEAGNPPVAFFTNPSDCSGEPLVSTAHVDSWQSPGPFVSNGTPEGEALVEGSNWMSAASDKWPAGGTVTPATGGAVTGCNQLRFVPSAFTFAPDEAHRQADEPAGYESVLRIPQNETPGSLATPPLKTAVVTLPPGVAVSPAAADGLVGCQESGPEGMNFESANVGDCPAASNIGKVEVVTPLLEEPLTEGGVFVAQPKCGGAGQPECTEEMAEKGGVFALYMEVGSEKTGIHVKLKGKVEVGGNGQYSRENGLQPGQIRTTFGAPNPVTGKPEPLPQLPFSELKLKFNSGPRAPLANPQTCGTFTTNASLTPWSAPESGPPAIEEPSFGITGCENKFAPAFEADVVNPQAGAYAPFTLTFSRQDREQDLSGVTVNMPPGLLGKIAGIQQCGEAEANAGRCSAASRIGTASASAGSGSHPFWQSGSVYLTGPYKSPVTGAEGPFGLSVVVPAKAGPYNLGLIVVRASIRINPVTAAVTVVSNPLPQSVDGVRCV